MRARSRRSGVALVVVATIGLPAAFAAVGTSTRATAPTQTVVVILREYSIVLPATLRPGRTTFVLRNRGRFPHNFTAIYGPTRFRSQDVPPGATERLTAKLSPGAYMVACTVLGGGHLAQGMFALFTIGSRRHGSAIWHYP